MDVRIRFGNPSVDEARAIERAFAQLEAEARAAEASQRRVGRDAWTLSGRIAAHNAASSLRHG